MRRTLYILMILSFFSLLIAGNIAVFTEVSATPSTDKVVLSWVTKTELNVDKFAVLRSSDDVSYIELARVRPKGPGSHYEYVDGNVMFKDVSPLFYKIRAIDIQGKVLDETSLIVHPSISGIFRTWGTLKALFR